MPLKTGLGSFKVIENGIVRLLKDHDFLLVFYCTNSILTQTRTIFKLLDIEEYRHLEI